MEAEDTEKCRRVDRGVPQGSVLRPTLCNILWDELWRVDLPDGVTLIAFAYDIAMLIQAKAEEMDETNVAMLRVAKWHAANQLDLAPKETEVAFPTKRRRISRVVSDVRGLNIDPTSAVKYLGVWIDTELTLAYHVKEIIEETEKTITALSHRRPVILQTSIVLG